MRLASSFGLPVGDIEMESLTLLQLTRQCGGRLVFIT